MQLYGKTDPAIASDIIGAFASLAIVGDSGDDYIIYSNYIELSQGGTKSLYAQFTSAAGTPNVKIEAEMSSNGGVSYATAEPITIESGANDELEHCYSLSSLVVGTGMRLKLTGLSGNAADTVLALARICAAY